MFFLYYFYSSEAMFPPNGSDASTHWKGCFQTLEAMPQIISNKKV